MTDERDIEHLGSIKGSDFFTCYKTNTFILVFQNTISSQWKNSIVPYAPLPANYSGVRDKLEVKLGHPTGGNRVEIAPTE
jgi:hypothetical protein